MCSKSKKLNSQITFVASVTIGTTLFGHRSCEPGLIPGPETLTKTQLHSTQWNTECQNPASQNSQRDSHWSHQESRVNHDTACDFVWAQLSANPGIQVWITYPFCPSSWLSPLRLKTFVSKTSTFPLLPLLDLHILYMHQYIVVQMGCTTPPSHRLRPPIGMCPCTWSWVHSFGIATRSYLACNTFHLNHIL